jgi:hypothetical protein
VNFVYHWLGMDNGSGHVYLFWSGFGSDLTEFAILGAVWHHLNCHEPGCWRVGRRVTAGPDGIHIRRCARHHQAYHQLPLTEGATP